MELKACGDRAILLDCADLDEALAWHAALSPRVEAVLGARTVLLRGEPAALRSLLVETRPAASDTARPSDQAQPSDAVRIPVTYDGPDIAEVATLTGLTTAEVVAAHTGRPWTVAFAGFAPGFAYLTGGDPRLHVPRRDSPRSRVEPGAVGLAGEFSGVYPRASPGGWQLIGRTAVPLWDLDREPPALLTPGATVWFEPVQSGEAR